MQNTPAETFVPLSLAGTSLFMFLEQVLSGTYAFAYGDMSGFFVARRNLVRRPLPVRGHSVPAPVFIKHIFFYYRKSFSPAVVLCHRIFFPEWRFYTLFLDFCF